MIDSRRPGTEAAIAHGCFAHSLPGRPAEAWERLGAHAHAVARSAGRFAEAFGWRGAAEAAGLLHDIGKCSAAFQAYIRDAAGAARGPDHSTAGALEALAAYPGPIGRIIAAIVAGHHAGLADGTDLETRLAQADIRSMRAGARSSAPSPPRRSWAGPA
ncbi:CRISPR-associated endonuclease Cas3'' [Salinarimonas soli]|uniref:CRISPR-associated endonuclease Cas3'' n=1 Tax=Salinarimonas soli TaxID=1638099 RepID=UPI001AED17BF|nr:CRISPR-associated endonuclease Cas3'' [Salinarimonas soli]